MLRRFLAADRRGPISISHAFVASSPQLGPLRARPRLLHAGAAQRSSRPLRAQSSTAAAVALGAVCVSAAFAFVAYRQTSAAQLSTNQNAVMTQLPGRPGNLTTEELAKLQEFWKATLKVFGVSAADVSELAEDVKSNLVVEDDEEEAEKIDGNEDAKKKKRGLFGRKKKDKSIKSDRRSSVDTMSVGGADDKYGQTKDFLKALASNTPEAMRTAFWSMVKADHPDALLLRFLRARKWDIEKALVMMISTLHWRLNEMHVDDDIMLNGEGGALQDTKSSDPNTKKAGLDFLTQLRRGESFLHGLDKEGRPICVIRVRLHKPGQQSERSMEKFTVFTIETGRLMTNPPADTASIIFDMTDFSLSNMDYAPVKFIIKVFEANYPETLGVVLIHKAPWVFQGIWRIIRGWLDPVVAAKIHFTNNRKDMEAYIEPSRMQTDLGGDEEWDYEFPEPEAGENDRMKDTATRDRLYNERQAIANEFESLTRDWTAGPTQDSTTMTQRNKLAEELKRAYWKLDPYIRARSWYDRVGVIGEDGVATFYEEFHDALELPASSNGAANGNHKSNGAA